MQKIKRHIFDHYIGRESGIYAAICLVCHKRFTKKSLKENIFEECNRDKKCGWCDYTKATIADDYCICGRKH